MLLLKGYFVRHNTIVLYMFFPKYMSCEHSIHFHPHLHVHRWQRSLKNHCFFLVAFHFLSRKCNVDPKKFVYEVRRLAFLRTAGAIRSFPR